ncbi:acyl carrier protein [Micromonospora sp. NPDC050397]|uniref:acyl carrier protein n=1 Tax=Micromonospora sp. NPDC050397 TaxID=3364279 RepID=UPI003850221F
MPDPVVEPTTPEGAEMREQIQEIWSEVLRVPCPPDGRFFALGGHSLAAFWIVARVEQDYGVSVDPADLFDDPQAYQFADRVAGMLQRIRGRRSGRPGSGG